MPKTKDQKKKIVEEITQNLSQQKSVVFVDMSKLKLKDLTGLRKMIKKTDGKLSAAKRTLINLAFKKRGFNLDESYKGQATLVYGFKDAIKPIKEIYEFSKKNENLKILFGIFEGKQIPKEEVVALAQLPSKDELLAKLVGSLSAPMSGFANVLQGNLRGLVLALSRIKK